MKNIWTLACLSSSVDQNTNELSIFKALEEIEIKHRGDNFSNEKINFVPINFEIISTWYDENKDKDRLFKMLTEIRNSADEILLKRENDVIMEKNKNRLRTIIKINGFPIKTEGAYKIVTKYKEEKKYQLASEIPINIKIKKEA